MVYQEGDAIDLGDLIQPKAEAEIAFVLKHDLMGPGVTAMDVIRATECVMPCFEIVDSRITRLEDQDPGYRRRQRLLRRVRARRHAWCDARKVDLTLGGMVLEKNGEIVATGAGAATMGSPAKAVAWLANTLGRLGMPLKAGEVILSGSLGPMVPVAAGDNLRVSIGGVGSCAVRFA